ncbi:MAG: arsenosugar biosynthesis arsenite methyltransferase ArsM [Cyanobacteria bacterium P01_F01_bin.153]
MTGYLETTADFYREVAVTPEVGLCCVQGGSLKLPGLNVPDRMNEMNYGCGTTVQPQELVDEPTVMYVGVGGGLEALQFAYFSRRPGAVIAVEPVAEMRQAARENLEEAARLNDWFDPSFVEIREGGAFDLPADDGIAGVYAQNCLFNIFEPADLQKALQEAHRVLQPRGRLMMSDPIAARPIPAHLQADERLRAMCLSGAQTYERYVGALVDVGFGQVEIRARRPYRMLDKVTYNLDEDLLLESLDSVAYKVPVAPDGACIFTGRTAIYIGSEPLLNDGKGHTLPKGIPTGVCDKTASALAKTDPDTVLITPPTWHYQGDGCC